jgi:hypothetical protein
VSSLYLSGLAVYSQYQLGGSANYSTSTPYFGLSGTTGLTQYGAIPPVLIPIYGSQTVTNYSVQYPWANYFDLILCGGGAGGDAGGSLQGSYGGPCGNWNGVTLNYVQIGTANITWTIGNGGSGGVGTSVGGSSGGTSYVTVPGWSTLSAAGGVGHGTSIATGSQYGSGGVSSPTYNFTNAYGGTDTFSGGAGGATPGAVGQQPGGGGAGGNAAYTGSYVQGGPGGPGIGYCYIYQ